jgi:uncharacterized membrane protein
MQMKGRITWILLTIVMAALFHVLTVKAYPYYIMFKLSKSRQGVINTIHHAPPTTAESRAVVRPSPDLLYSACGYDVKEKPLRITAQAPGDTYWSLSIFAANTDNFFVINDRQLDSRHAEVILVREGKTYPDHGDALVVEAPIDLGVVLLRMLITDEEKIDDLIKIQKQASCSPVE